VVDFDVGLRNLDLVMGAERRVVFDLINVVQGVAKLQQALIRDKRLETLWLLPASQTRDKDALTEQGVADVIRELRGKFDWVICDSPAGIERGATLAMRFADAAVIVTNPEVSSVRDSDRIIGLLDSKTEKAEKGQRVEKHILITRYDAQRAARGEMLTIEDVLEILSTPLLGIIPESEEVLRASNIGSPVTLSNAGSSPARAYLDAARRLKGDDVPMTIPSDRKGLLDKLFGRRAPRRCSIYSAAGVRLRLRGSGFRSCCPTSGERAANPTCSPSCARKSSPRSPSTSPSNARTSRCGWIVARASPRSPSTSKSPIPPACSSPRDRSRRAHTSATTRLQRSARRHFAVTNGWRSSIGAGRTRALNFSRPAGSGCATVRSP
jgi:septum site-determining protein MinD